MIRPLKLEDITQSPECYSAWQLEAVGKWAEKLTDRVSKFPCIPAVQGFALNHLRYGFVRMARDAGAAEALAELLRSYGRQSKEFGTYTSLVVFIQDATEFRNRQDGVEYYERLFWSLLSRTTELDSTPWPAHLPEDPTDCLWEFCFDGEPYFVYCGTPAHRLRRSRSFSCMVLAFTPRWVLQEFGVVAVQAEKTKKAIRKRLEAYDQVPAHPELNLYGAEDNYEWKQYFIRDSLDSLPTCPFRRNDRKEGST